MIHNYKMFFYRLQKMSAENVRKHFLVSLLGYIATCIKKAVKLRRWSTDK